MLKIQKTKMKVHSQIFFSIYTLEFIEVECLWILFGKFKNVLFLLYCLHSISQCCVMYKYNGCFCYDYDKSKVWIITRPTDLLAFSPLENFLLIYSILVFLFYLFYFILIFIFPFHQFYSRMLLKGLDKVIYFSLFPWVKGLNQFSKVLHLTSTRYDCWKAII